MMLLGWRGINDGVVLRFPWNSPYGLCIRTHAECILNLVDVGSESFHVLFDFGDTLIGLLDESLHLPCGFFRGLRVGLHSLFKPLHHLNNARWIRHGFPKPAENTKVKGEIVTNSLSHKLEPVTCLRAWNLH